MLDGTNNLTFSLLNCCLRGGNSETGFSPIAMLIYGESLPHDNSLCNLIN